MAIKLRRSDNDDSGLDSLLDTMTNVVGILVLVLIVTQLSVAEVVSKIVSETTVDEESLQELSQQLEIKRAEQNELERILVDPLDIDTQRQREELQKKKELLERRKRLLEEKKKEKNQYALKIAEDQKKAEQNSKIMADTEEKRKELQTLITTSLEQKAELEAKLDKTPRVAVPADVRISIPNPRPPPPGAMQFMVVCAENRLYPVNSELIQKDAENKVKMIIERFNLKADPVNGIDPEAFKARYEQLKEQDEFFDIEYFVQANRYPRIRLVPRTGRGAGEKELVNSRSRLRANWLSKVDVTKYFARFYVLPDSYDIYLTARRFFNKSNMLSGWDPQPEGWVLVLGVPGGIELGPPREPPVNPPPRRKPANLID